VVEYQNKSKGNPRSNLSNYCPVRTRNAPPLPPIPQGGIISRKIVQINEPGSQKKLSIMINTKDLIAK
jgi:hypothetical protein